MHISTNNMSALCVVYYISSELPTDHTLFVDLSTNNMSALCNVYYINFNSELPTDHIREPIDK